VQQSLLYVLCQPALINNKKKEKNMNELKLQHFYDHLVKDPDCRTRAKEIGDDMTALAAYARELGYEITAEELTVFTGKAKQLLETKWKEIEASNESLSDGAKQFMAFSQLADTDAEVEKRITEASQNPQELIAYGKEKGFTFDTDDMKEVAKKLMEQEEELNDEELEAVAGGTTLAVVFVISVMAVVGGAVGVGVGVAGVGAVVGAVVLAE